MNTVSCRRWFFIISLCVCVFVWTLFSLDFQFLLPKDNTLLRPSFNFEFEVTYESYDDTLIDIQNFQYLMNNASICVAPTVENHSAIVVIVHTARSHFNERYAIRNTWGSCKLYRGWFLHLAFLLGSDPTSDPEFEARLWDESKQYGDLIMGSFVDSYKNLTYKHIMGYKWVSTFCPSAKFILKTDDDIYADIFQIVDVMLVELINSKRTYACQNMGGNKPQRNPKNTWYVSEDLYSREEYPVFCSGGAYIMKADDAAKIYSVCNKTNFLWIDDVFVTGILRETYNSQMNNDSKWLDVLTMNSRYNLSCSIGIKKWCSSGEGLGTNPLKYTFVLIDKHDIVRDMFCIWNEIRLKKYAINHAFADTNYLTLI